MSEIKLKIVPRTDDKGRVFIDFVDIHTGAVLTGIRKLSVHEYHDDVATINIDLHAYGNDGNPYIASYNGEELTNKKIDIIERDKSRLEKLENIVSNVRTKLATFGIKQNLNESNNLICDALDILGKCDE